MREKEEKVSVGFLSFFLHIIPAPMQPCCNWTGGASIPRTPGKSGNRVLQLGGKASEHRAEGKEVLQYFFRALIAQLLLWLYTHKKGGSCASDLSLIFSHFSSP